MRSCTPPPPNKKGEVVEDIIFLFLILCGILKLIVEFG